MHMQPRRYLAKNALILANITKKKEMSNVGNCSYLCGTNLEAKDLKHKQLYYPNYDKKIGNPRVYLQLL